METRASRKRKLLLKEAVEDKAVRSAMETRASRKRKLLLKEAVEDKEDRISNLPDGILHHILSFLPVKSIAQTSVLSRRWNYLWATLPCLDFSEFGMKEKKRERKREAMELIIKTVLAGRHANFNIKAFRFDGRHLGLTCLRDWICQLVRHSVEELELDVTFGGRFNLPPCLFDCDSLKILTLKTHYRDSWFQFCSHDFTRTSGLRSLQALTLKHVRFINNDSAALFSGSSFPALKRLTLNICVGVNRLNIGCLELEDFQVERTKINGLDISSGERLKNLRVINSFRASKNESWVKIFAPKLETFCWENNEFPEECSVQSFPFLKTCRICITSSRGFGFNINAGKIHHAISFLSGVVSTQKLNINITDLCAAKIFSFIQLEGGHQFPFLNLRALEVCTRLSKCEIPGIVCLLRNAPLVHTLKLDIIRNQIPRRNCYKWGINLLDNCRYTEEQYWESEARVLRSFLDHLKVLKINVHFSMRKSTITATRFLLKHGSVLQEVTLSSKDSRTQYLWKEKFIIDVPWGSPHVQISIKG